MQKLQETALAKKEKEAAAALQRAHRENFNRAQNNTPGPSSSANARSGPDVEMEEGGARSPNMEGGGARERESEKVHPNGSKDKGKHIEKGPMTQKPKPTSRHVHAQAGSWKNIERRKKDASTKSQTFLHAQVTSSLVIFPHYS